MHKETQNEKVLNYLQRWESITSREAFSALSITRLAPRIFELRKQGYNIETVLPGNYAEYRLLKEEKK